MCSKTKGEAVFGPIRLPENPDEEQRNAATFEGIQKLGERVGQLEAELRARQ